MGIFKGIKEPGFGPQIGTVPHIVIKSDGAAEGGFPGTSTSAPLPVPIENSTQTVMRFDKKVRGEQSNLKFCNLLKQKISLK